MGYLGVKRAWLLIAAALGLIFTVLWNVEFEDTAKICRPRVPNAKVEIYVNPICIFCRKAKELLDNKDISYQEYNIVKCPESRKEMLLRSGNQRTVPQVFIHGIHIGGFDSLNALNKAGSLESLIDSVR